MSNITGLHVRPHCNLAKDGSRAFIRFEPVEPAYPSYTIALTAAELQNFIMNAERWLSNMLDLQRKSDV